MATLQTGLVSVTLRSLAPERVVELARRARIDAIEWGGDVHVPHGDLPAARRVRQLCDEAGVAIYAYGSYYRCDALDSPDFKRVLDTAEALRAPSIRVWAGKVGSARADDALRSRIRDDLARICDLAAACSINVATEFHDDTLTDTPESAVKLLGAVGHPQLRTYWQPRHGQSVDQNTRDIEMLRPWLANVHAFHWWPDHHTRLPFADGVDRWRTYLRALCDRPRVVALEFVRGDDPSQLLSDAATLRDCIERLP